MGKARKPEQAYASLRRGDVDQLRTPFLIAAIVAALLAVLTELGSSAWLDPTASSDLPTPGLGIPYLALVDGIVLYTLGFFGLALVVPARILGAVQGIITFIFSLLMLIGSIVAIIVAVLLLTLMVTLLLAVPFGTLAYLAIYADFRTGAASATLGVLMTLKVAMVILLALAQQRFLTVKGLVLLFATSLLANVVVSFLHALVPSILVSILDAIAAIIVGVLAAIWALVKLVGSIPGILKGLRFDRHV
jgi:hypothetical protein